MPEPQIMVIIPARGGSKGVPRKALQMLGNKPLIAYTISDALCIAGNCRVCVSTDDAEIRKVSLRHGAEVPFLRPPRLARDHSDLQDVMVHMREWHRQQEGFTWDIEIVMFPTYPFRRPGRINDALWYGLEHPKVYNICSAVPLVDPLEACMVQREVELWAPMFSSEDVRDVTAVGIAMSFNIVFHKRQVSARRIPWIVSPVEGVDIDEWADLELARRVVEAGFYPLSTEGEKVGHVQ